MQNGNNILLTGIILPAYLCDSLKNNATVENYLHEAGLVKNAPSGTVYQNGNGKQVNNLGVHEHWNNPVERKYSRNLGEKEGIELIQIMH